MPASSSSPTAVLVDDSDPELGELGQVPAAPPGLWQCLAKVTDPRKRRGVRHPITGVLALALAATLAGAQSFLGIAEWAADAGAGELAALGLGGVVPCESTIRRCLQRLDPSSLDTLIGGWMWFPDQGARRAPGHRVGRQVPARCPRRRRELNASALGVVSAVRDGTRAAVGGCED